MVRVSFLDERISEQRPEDVKKGVLRFYGRRKDGERENHMAGLDTGLQSLH